jgi:ElaB/YqjD/DUF883 family membrane-anchored ribosome-binding protein
MSHDTSWRPGEDLGNAVEETADQVGSKIDEVSGKIREKGSELGRKAVASIDERRAGVADSLEGAARGLHDKADSIVGGSERVSQVTHEVADKVENASRYIRDKDAKDMLADVESMVRAHPTRSLLAVLAVGWLAGRALRRD